jgi:hypothetical protein
MSVSKVATFFFIEVRDFIESDRGSVSYTV